MIARCTSFDQVHAAPPEAAVWLKRLLIHLAMLAEQDVQRLHAHPETAIHHLRKRMKKLLALLRMARPVLSGEQFSAIKTIIRNVKKAVAAPRDQQVLARLASDLADDHRSRKSQPDRPKRRKTAPNLRIAPAICDQLVKQTSSLTDRLGRLRLFSLSWDTVAETYVKTYRRGHKARAKSEEEQSTEELHRWRKLVKDHYYQTLALFAWLGHPRRLRRTRRLSSLLGRVHDLDLFCESQELDDAAREDTQSRRDKLTIKIFKKGARVYAKAPGAMANEVREKLPE